MSSRRLLMGSALFAVGATIALPAFAHATGIPFFGPIVPTLNQTCAGNFTGLIQTVENAFSFLLTIAIVFIAPLMIAYAGFLMVFEATAPGGHKKARTLLRNLVIGIVVALAAWFLVDMVLNTLTAKGLSQWTSGMFGGGTATCMQIAVGGVTIPSTGSTANALQPVSTSGQGACDPTIVQTAASSGGFNITSAQAQTLACIAKPESSCGTGSVTNTACWNTACPGNANGSASTAAGAYQVLLSGHSICYNNPVCEQAAGQAGTALNCSNAFSNGFIKSDSASQALAQKCVQAAANISCSAAAAACLVQQNPTFSDWASAGDKSCVAQYNH